MRAPDPHTGEEPGPALIDATVARRVVAAPTRPPGPGGSGRLRDPHLASVKMTIVRIPPVEAVLSAL
jgi:hypothetical protein